MNLDHAIVLIFEGLRIPFFKLIDKFGFLIVNSCLGKTNILLKLLKFSIHFTILLLKVLELT